MRFSARHIRPHTTTHSHMCDQQEMRKLWEGFTLLDADADGFFLSFFFIFCVTGAGAPATTAFFPFRFLLDWVLLLRVCSSSLRVLYTTGFSRWCPSCIIIIFQRDEFSLCCPAAATTVAVDLRRSTLKLKEKKIWMKKKKRKSKKKRHKLSGAHTTDPIDRMRNTMSNLYITYYTWTWTRRARDANPLCSVSEWGFFSALDFFFFSCCSSSHVNSYLVKRRRKIQKKKEKKMKKSLSQQQRKQLTHTHDRGNSSPAEEGGRERLRREAKSLNSRDQWTADHERKFINVKLVACTVHTLRVSAAAADAICHSENARWHEKCERPTIDG